MTVGTNPFDVSVKMLANFRRLRTCTGIFCLSRATAIVRSAASSSAVERLGQKLLHAKSWIAEVSVNDNHGYCTDTLVTERFMSSARDNTSLALYRP